MTRPNPIQVTGARQLITTRTMAAYRPGTCPCGQPIAVGDRIAFIRGRWRCDVVCNAVGGNRERSDRPEAEEG